MEKGASSPFTEDSGIRLACLMQRSWKHPFTYRLGEHGGSTRTPRIHLRFRRRNHETQKDTKGRLGLLGIRFHRSSFVYLLCFVVETSVFGLNHLSQSIHSFLRELGDLAVQILPPFHAASPKYHPNTFDCPALRIFLNLF